MLAGMHLRGCSVWPCYASVSKSLVYLSYKEAPAPLTLPQYYMQLLKSIRFLIIRTTALHTFTPTVITNYLMLYIASQSSNLHSLSQSLLSLICTASYALFIVLAITLTFFK